ncbi:MAG TPA: mycofactocin-coupled SDR family oxidoreductase [Solirubrobacteraceae bacterium]|jgi:SDR family mycofactocin-dependent oxidoreductase|nr:mycofactocin-coupled SDR family oxidoreductase [Solirubrobacteraceae bacterium]
MGRLEGKVAVITGGARGQGRSHAIRLAEEGAQIVVSDIARQLPTVKYAGASEGDLAETVRLVEELDQRCVSVVADARSAEDCKRVADSAMSEFGHIDILSVNHGIATFGSWDTPEEEWDEMIDINLKGVWQSVKAVVPHMIAAGNGGAITLTSSVAGIKAYYGTTAYGAAKHGVIGLMKTLAADLGPHMIRVNAICPATVNTPMVDNPETIALFTGGKDGGTMKDIEFPSQAMNLMPVPWVEARDISNALLWLSSDEARYVTGLAVPVDLGLYQQPSGISPEVGALLAGG